MASLSMPQDTTRSGWMRMIAGASRASARPRTSTPRGRQGLVLARSSTTMAARPVAFTSRYFLVRAKSRPLTSIVSCSAL
jgi:hypothetical protein